MYPDPPDYDPLRREDARPGDDTRFIASIIVAVLLLVPLVFVLGTVLMDYGRPGGVCHTWIGILLRCRS